MGLFILGLRRTQVPGVGRLKIEDGLLICYIGISELSRFFLFCYASTNEIKFILIRVRQNPGSLLLGACKWLKLCNDSLCRYY